MSLQSHYVIGLHRDENPTKNRCRHNIACPLGYLEQFLGAKIPFSGDKLNTCIKGFSKGPKQFLTILKLVSL